MTSQPVPASIPNAAVERLQDLLSKASKRPWVRANLANVTIGVRDLPNGTQRSLSYCYEDNLLATEAVNWLPTLLQIAQDAQAIEAQDPSAYRRESGE